MKVDEEEYGQKDKKREKVERKKRKSRRRRRINRRRGRRKIRRGSTRVQGQKKGKSKRDKNKKKVTIAPQIQLAQRDTNLGQKILQSPLRKKGVDSGE